MPIRDGRNRLVLLRAVTDRIVPMSSGTTTTTETIDAGAEAAVAVAAETGRIIDVAPEAEVGVGTVVIVANQGTTAVVTTVEGNTGTEVRHHIDLARSVHHVQTFAKIAARIVQSADPVQIGSAVAALHNPDRYPRVLIISRPLLLWWLIICMDRRRRRRRRRFFVTWPYSADKLL